MKKKSVTALSFDDLKNIVLNDAKKRKWYFDTRSNR